MMNTHALPHHIFNTCLRHVLQIEGGLVNDAVDKGGLTKYGISQRQYPHVNIAALTTNDASQIYYRDYWLKYSCNYLSPVAAALLFDAVVNHNPVPAIKFIQYAVGVKQDGIIGKRTIAASHKANAKTLLYKALSKRSQFYCKICLNNPTQTRFLLGWQRRLFSLQQFIIASIL